MADLPGAAQTPSTRSTGSRTCPFVRGQTAALPRGEVNYTLSGPPSPAPLLVCIHGLHGSVSSFAALEPLLASFGFRVLAFDLYGFGLSAAPRGRLDHHTYAEQLASLLDALHVGREEPVLLLGYSMGGLVAVEFARRWPERVKRLLLVAPGGMLQREATPYSALLFKGLRGRCGCCLQHLATGIACLCGFVAGRLLTGDRHAEKFEPDVREPERFKHVSQANMERYTWNFGRSVNSYLRVLRRMPLWEEDSQESYEWLARSGMPVLFLWGDNDGVVPWAEAEDTLVRLFGPGGSTSCILLRGAGHGLLLEDAPQVGQCAMAWLANVQDPAWLQCLQRFRVPKPEEDLEATVVGAPSAA